MVKKEYAILFFPNTNEMTTAPKNLLESGAYYYDSPLTGMRQMKKIMSLIFLSVFLTSCEKTDSTNASVSQEAGSKLGADRYLSLGDSFDVATNNIGKDFKGHNYVELGKYLSENIYSLGLPRKDEFETTDQYENRISEFNPLADLSELSKSEQFFVFLDSWPYSNIEYNADNKVLEIMVNLYYPKSENFISNSKIIKGSNVFGRKVKIQYTDETDYSLKLMHYTPASTTYSPVSKYILPYSAITPEWLFIDPSRNINENDPGSFTRSFKMSLEKAKEIKHELDILIITTLRSPYLQTYERTVEPTIDEPFAGERISRTVIAQIEQIWLFNSNDGSVIKKWPESDASGDNLPEYNSAHK